MSYEDVKACVKMMRELGIVEFKDDTMQIKLAPPPPVVHEVKEEDLRALLRDQTDTPANEEALLFWSADGGSTLNTDGEKVEAPLT